MKYLLGILLSVSAYADCPQLEAQVIAKVKKMTLVENACVYSLEVNDLNVNPECPLNKEVINHSLAVDYYCQYVEGDTLKNVLVKIKGDNKVYVD